MAKSPSLLKSTKERIGKYKASNPNSTIGEVANKFACSYSQARTAIEDYKAGKLKSTQKKGVSKSKIQSIIDNSLPDDSLREEYEYVLSSIRADKKIESTQRVLLLDKLISMRKTLQIISLENHLKRADAELISMIIRRFDPSATNERIIQIYNEELSKLRASK